MIFLKQNIKRPFATCWPSGSGGVWVLQRVKYAIPHFFEKQKYEIKAVQVVL